MWRLWKNGQVWGASRRNRSFFTSLELKIIVRLSPRLLTKKTHEKTTAQSTPHKYLGTILQTSIYLHASKGRLVPLSIKINSLKRKFTLNLVYYITSGETLIKV
jgi:hypothetical protein